MSTLKATKIETLSGDSSKNVSQLVDCQLPPALGQVPMWDGARWMPETPQASGATGPAGGVLAGNYPNPEFAQPMATRQELEDLTLPLAALEQSAATLGQVPAWDGSAWVPTTPSGGGGGGAPSGPAGGVLAGVYPNPEFAEPMATLAALNTGLAGRQETLQSGVNIKTLNGQSLLGAGDIQIAGGGGSPRIWQSGMTVTQGEIVTSPLDWEDYRRIAATGSDTVDPADDNIDYIAWSYRRVTAFTGSHTEQFNNGGGIGNAFNGAIKVSRASPQGERTQWLSIQGRGALKFLGFTSPTALIRTRLIEVILDGRALFSAPVAFPYVAGRSVILAGSFGAGMTGTTLYPAYVAVPTAEIPFKRSLEIYITCQDGSDSSGHFHIGYMFEPEA